MARETEPQFTVEDTSENQERAARLALFLDVIREQPDVMSAILKSAGTPREVIKDSLKIEPGNDGTFVSRALRASAPIFQHEDDLEATPDPTTVTAMRNAIEQDSRQGSQVDRRILRMSVLACEFASYQVDHPYVISEEFNDEEVAAAEATPLPVPLSDELVVSGGFVESA